MKTLSNLLPVALLAMAFVWTGCDNDDNDVVESDPQPTIFEVAADAGTFETLVAAVEAAGLVETLESDGPFTVFAPSDAAFAALPEGTVQSLLQPENRDQLTSILTYHVVAGRVPASDVVSLSSAKTVQGSDVSISVNDGTVMINGATVVQTDIEASNGIIHVIDSVLLPPTEGAKRGRAAVVGNAAPAAAASDVGTLNVVHLIPGATVDVCVKPSSAIDFSRAIEAFAFGQVRTFELPAADYDANVVLAGNDCSAALPGLSATGVTLPAGANASVTANLAEGGDFELNVFVNDLVTDGNGPRVAVRHTADAPAVDVWVGRNVEQLARTFENVANGAGAQADVRPGRLTTALSLPGGDEVIFGPQDLTLNPFTYYEVYAAGTFGSDFTFVVNAIPLR